MDELEQLPFKTVDGVQLFNGDILRLPNGVVAVIKPEVRIGTKSRFDFALCYVKGDTGRRFLNFDERLKAERIGNMYVVASIIHEAKLAGAI